MKFYKGYLKLSRHPEEVSHDPRARKCNLERRVELERFRYGAGPAYIGIESCALVIFLMKYLCCCSCPGILESSRTISGQENMIQRGAWISRDC